MLWGVGEGQGRVQAAGTQPWTGALKGAALHPLLPSRTGCRPVPHFPAHPSSDASPGLSAHQLSPHLYFNFSMVPGAQGRARAARPPPPAHCPMVFPGQGPDWPPPAFCGSCFPHPETPPWPDTSSGALGPHLAHTCLPLQGPQHRVGGPTALLWGHSPSLRAFLTPGGLAHVAEMRLR